MDEYLELLENQPIEKINEACLNEFTMGLVQGVVMGMIITIFMWFCYNNQMRR